MSREWQSYLQDIIQCCQKIQRYVGDYDLPQLIQDDRTMDAVLRNLEIIGEAVAHLPEEVLETMPQIDWRNIRGLRNVIAHGYFGIDEKIVWDIIANKVPLLLAAIES